MSENLSQIWKTPNELLKIQRLKLRKKALTARLEKKNPIDNNNILNNINTEIKLVEYVAEKRRNPFAKETHEIQNTKKQKKAAGLIPGAEESVLELINDKSSKPQLVVSAPPYHNNNIANLFKEIEFNDDELDSTQQNGEKLPFDWSLKHRMRILCETALMGINLKTSQEASGITGFVRCIDGKSTSTNLDISFGARFHQATHYWQHPYLPWMTLFPRNSKENIGIQIGQRERESLSKDWVDSFRGIFQLVRARQCPYFYLCANTFTVLFRSAGIGGRVETHALMSPTSRGIRSALKQEEIEFTMPLKTKSNEGSFSSDPGEPTSDGTLKGSCQSLNELEDNLEEEEDWLESLGVDKAEIKKISALEARKKLTEEIANDFSDQSLVLIEGVECQAFYNFLLNAKSTIAGVGRLAGVPPTLLAPIAFPKATMQSLTTRSSKVRNEGTDYFSLELKGVILPHTLPYITSLLCATKDAFSITLAGHNKTFAFTKATQKLILDAEKDNQISDQVFRKENLSDCGLQNDIIDAMCCVKNDAVSHIERMCFTKDVGFIWS